MSVLMPDPTPPSRDKEFDRPNLGGPWTGDILVVDDDAHVRSTMGSTLELRGYGVTLAADGREAFELLGLGHFDLVLTDIAMEDGSGINLLERILERQPTLPVVIVTAIHDIRVAIDTMRRGASDYLLKPFEQDQLIVTVQRALHHRKALADSQNYQQRLEQIVLARTEMLHHAMRDLEHSHDVTLDALGDALDMRDSETKGHSKRVTAYTIALARAMGLPQEEVKLIARGAFLHDIGKMAIPDEILHKSGDLTPEEQKVMREHCLSGYLMLRKIPFLIGPAEIVFCHQECYDGSGYPRALVGGQIPIGARIFAVADALDAMTSDRPYRKLRSFEDASHEIVKGSGTQFDPAVVEQYLKIPNELWQELRAEIESHEKQFSTFGLTEIPGSPDTTDSPVPGD